MPTPAIYPDECIDHRLAATLRESGFDVLTVVEANALSIDDESQLIFATESGRVLLSQNQIDFRRLHSTFSRNQRHHGGIMLIPQTTPFDRFVVRARLMLDWVSTFDEHQGRLFTWSNLQQQLIHGFRLSHWDEAAVRSAIGWNP